MITRHLKDFGTQGMKAPRDRFAEYQKQCKSMPKERQAEFWMKCMRADPEVAKLTNHKILRGSRL